MDPPATNPADIGVTRFDDLDFTIHEYHNSTSSFSRISQATILSETYNLLKGSTKWVTSPADIQVIKFNYSSWFTLTEEPPTIETSVEIKNVMNEWGSSPSEDEIFELHELEDFVGSDLTYLLDNKIAHLLKVAEPEYTKLESSEREIKKRRLNLAPIHYLIPQPHIYPSPFLSVESYLKNISLSGAEPCFVAPYSSLSVEDDARVAWLVPIRGVLPWGGCSSGTFLDDGSDYSPISSVEFKAQILWTSTSLLKFWDFLIELRTASTVGALGISFHGAQNSQRARTTAANPIPKVPLFSTPVPTSNPISGASGSRPTLLTLDYIKVYHDVRRRLHLRHLLDEWSCSIFHENGQSQQVKVLKGSRLALLDDISHAILVL